MTINEVRDLLFNEVVPGQGYGQDLIALDVERGRDHGIPDYNTLRVDLGLPAVTSFSQISSNPQVVQELEEAYPGGVNTIDAFEGGLAEDPVPGSDVGPLFQAIMVNQFTRLRDGDRFFYLNEDWNQQELQIFEQGDTLAKVIENNTDITNLQSDVFFFTGDISGTVWQDSNTNPTLGARAAAAIHGPGMDGITVELEDTSGDVLATTTTNAQGQYSFNQLSGPASNVINNSGVSGTGMYNIVLELPSGMKQVSTDPASVMVSRSGQDFNNVDFAVWSPTGSGYHRHRGYGNVAATDPPNDCTPTQQSTASGPDADTMLLGAGDLDAHGLGLESLLKG
jgi:hypothetical protein